MSAAESRVSDMAPGQRIRHANRVRDEQRAFASMIEPLFEPLLRYFARRTSPREDSYDCLSDTLLVMWRRRGSAPTHPEEFRAWAYGVARLTLSNHMRSQRRRARLLEKSRNDAELEVTVGADLSEVAATAMAALSAKDRELVRLIVWDGLGVAEAGQVLGFKAATARTRYSRARERLRHTLGESA